MVSLGAGLAGAAGGALGGIGLHKASQKAQQLGSNFFLSDKNTLFLPRLMQLFALGGDLSPISAKEYSKLGKSERFKFGGQRFRAADVSAEAIETAAVNAQRRQVDIQRETFDNLKGSPLFDSLFADSQNKTPLDFAQFAPALDSLSSRALGGAAQQGLNINDPATQAKILGPLALQAQQLQTQQALNQKQAQVAAGGRLAATLSGSGSAIAQSAAQGIPFFTQNVFNSANQRAQAGQFNVNAQNEQQAAEAAAFLGVGGGLLGGGIGAGLLG